MHSQNLFDAQANIKVIGVGGGGCNAVNRMIAARLIGVKFVAMNTDVQALSQSRAGQRLQLGSEVTSGLGSGGDPNVGEQAARESLRDIERLVEGADMVFVTAGMGGGTGTGAAPVVAEVAKSRGILTVGVATKPFAFEGPKRRRQAEIGAEKLKENVDTLITVPNDRLVDITERSTTLVEAFRLADDVLRFGVQGISEIILTPGLINVDFADVRSVMTDAGVAMMGLGFGRGPDRARLAADAAASSRLLETDINGAKRLLVNIATGPDFTLAEANAAMERLLQFVDPDDSDIIMGHVVKEDLGEEIHITVLAAGMGSQRHRSRGAILESSLSMPEMLAEPVSRELSAREEQAAPVGVTSAESLDIPTFLRRQRDVR